MAKLLTRTDILGKTKLKLVLVEVPEWEGEVYLKELSTGQLLEYNERIEVLKKEHPEVSPSTALELMALLLSFSVCDDQGNPIFAENDVRELANTSMSALITLSTKIMELSGVGTAAIVEVADQLKNAPTSSSPSA